MTNVEIDGPDVRFDPYAMTPAMRGRHGVRFDTLDGNSAMDFLSGFHKWSAEERHGATAIARAERHCAALGLEIGDTSRDYAACFELMLRDLSYATSVRLYRSAQRFMWDCALRIFHGDAESRLEELARSDVSGTGSLQLDPALDIPAYARHEIHAQPGGYVGDPFAGWVYHYALARAFYAERDPYGEIQLNVAQLCPKPADGSVRRILDLGCSAGQSTTAFKERFPCAEVWGIDAAGPMVRYAHHRAVQQGLEVHFAQRLAERTGFPDRHFDIVNAYLLFHEVDPDAARDAVAEIYRVLRPGGIYNHVDTITTGMAEAGPDSFMFRMPRTILSRANAWQDHRHNCEPSVIGYSLTDFPSLLRAVGFEVSVEAGFNGSPFPRLVATKPVATAARGGAACA